MNLNDADLAKSLECPVCLDLFDEPKLLNCGHTVCQKCVNKIRAAANAGPGRDGNSIKCPACGGETQILPDGLKTNYSLVDLVHRAQKPLVDVCACNGCGKQEPVADMFTCHTCQETLNCKPLWFCSLCAMKQHREHTTSECNKATQNQIREAYEGINARCSLADGYVGLTMSRFNGALKETELISQLLNQQKRGLSQLKARVEGASNDLTQDDLTASLQAANDLEQEIEQASAFANEAGKDLESDLRKCREKLENLLHKQHEQGRAVAEYSGTSDEEEPTETEGSGTSRNLIDLSEFEDDQEEIELTLRRIDAIPDLSRFSQIQVLGFHDNLLESINNNTIHATLTELKLHDNLITEIRGLDALVNLETLDLSYNRLKKIEAQQIEKIEGLETLVNLKLLALSDNRIKTIENLANQHNLQRLYLGRNRIRKIENVSHLTKLRVFNVSGNLITKLESLDTLVDLEELCVAEQGIETFDGIQKLASRKLKRIDAAKNSIASLHHLDHLQQLERLWLNDNKISRWSEVDKLAKLAKMEHVWLGGNPIQAQDHSTYRSKVFLALEQVTQVDGIPRC